MAPFLRLPDPTHEAAARALLRLQIEGDCWIWPGGVDGKGYGHIKRRQPRRDVKVHRLIYEVLVGPIPDGLTIDHLCRNRRCANPQHLEPVTLQENISRGEKATQTHCKRGHLLAGDNLYGTQPGHRNCRKCQQIRDRRRRRVNGGLSAA